jgi:hypothetical protein
MARKTKAELAAEREAELQARLAVAKATYTERLMALLERAVKMNYELTVKEGLFRVEDRDDRRSDAYLFTVNYTEASDSTLNTLEWYVMDKEEQAAEAERRSRVKQAALAKLSTEERELLGL